MRMDLRQLRYFIAVAEERSFTRAAERLHMAQPPLSRQIQQLEAEFDAELVDRSSKPLRLTPIGQLVLDQALQMVRRASDLREMVSRAKSAERQRFTIGFVASTIYARLPQLIRELRASAPHLDLVLLEMVSLEQIAALKEGRIDVGFGRIRFEDPAVTRIVLREERLAAALPANHALANEVGPLSLAQLAREPLIVYPREPRPSYADQVLALFRDHGLSPKVAHEARELQIAIGLVAAEEGVSIVPESVQRSRSDDVRYRDLVEPAVSPIIMSCRANERTDALRHMADVIARRYENWSYPVPEAVLRLAYGQD
jgi:DNA-binding transcriptional LysR family regulator